MSITYPSPDQTTPVRPFEGEQTPVVELEDEFDDEFEDALRADLIDLGLIDE